jgi:YVTN family beta-propeller protein
MLFSSASRRSCVSSSAASRVISSACQMAAPAGGRFDGRPRRKSGICWGGCVLALTALCGVLGGFVPSAEAQTAQFAGAVFSTVAVGSNPSGVAVSPDGSHIYVANHNGGTVSVIATATNTVTATVVVGSGPEGVAVTPDGTHVYVTNFSDSTVSVIATARNTVTATVAVGSGPEGVAVTPDGTHVYVTNFSDSTVSVIATSTNTVTATVTTWSGPEGVAVTPDGTHVYVASSIAFYVSEIATATNADMANIAVGQPIGVAVTPDGTHVYVTNSLYGNTVSVIATATNTVTATVAGESYPYGAAVSPDGTRVYITNNSNNTVSVIATATNTVTAAFPVGPNPEGVAVSPDGTLVYVTNNGGGTVSVIATTGVNFGTTPVATTTPPTLTLYFTFTTAGYLGSLPAVLTQGTTGLDFTDAGTGTCTTNGTTHTYAAGDTCTVNVKFTPRFAGTRNGAVQLLNSSGAAIATAYVHGIGTGPQAVFLPAVQTTVVP